MLPSLDESSVESPYRFLEKVNVPVKAPPMAPFASKAFGLSSPMPAFAGVVIEEAMPPPMLAPVLELPWADILLV